MVTSSEHMLWLQQPLWWCFGGWWVACQLPASIVTTVAGMQAACSLQTGLAQSDRGPGQNPTQETVSHTHTS